MAKRARSDDMDLLVTAINVQYEVGGNLTNVLENIATHDSRAHPHLA